MSPVLKRIAEVVAIAGVTVLVLAAGGYAAGARVNTTREHSGRPVLDEQCAGGEGAYVLFCPPRIGVFDDARGGATSGAGFCEGGYGYMMKRVLAAKNDAVTVAADGVRVNGGLLPHSAPIKADLAGRLLPRYQSDNYTLGGSELLLMSDGGATSFDGRYFGPVSRSQIKTVIRPVITW